MVMLTASCCVPVKPVLELLRYQLEQTPIKRKIWGKGLRAHIFTYSTSLENAQATVLKATVSLVKEM